ncbi:hypothetical protein [Microcystis sp. M112S1]|uniref:hypothetical protein n=1 Tax=Microcystis sp. M112S1 TaxID=2771103 RepID=UPI002589F932|nr:hypothetical protein [Microcystis sp. M112S1]MCA2949702.1 hypothetical protein [Microcystis sp. M109S1]MCA2951115.1 hypothetical protein [Microcystis sp. M112S1]
MRNPARERSRNLNREVWESPSVYGGEDVKGHFHLRDKNVIKRQQEVILPLQCDIELSREQ